MSPHSSYQVWVQSDLGFRSRYALKILKVTAILDKEPNNFDDSDSLCHSDVSHQASAQSDTLWEEMSFEDLQDGHL